VVWYHLKLRSWIKRQAIEIAEKYLDSLKNKYDIQSALLFAAMLKDIS
jgi:ribosomal protein S17E